MRANLYPPGAFSNYRYMQSASMSPTKPSKPAPLNAKNASRLGGFQRVVVVPAERKEAA